MNNIFKVNTCNNRYQITNDNGTLNITRYNEEWISKNEDLIGDGYVLSLVQHIEDLQNKLIEEDKTIKDKYRIVEIDGKFYPQIYIQKDDNYIHFLNKDGGFKWFYASENAINYMK